MPVISLTSTGSHDRGRVATGFQPKFTSTARPTVLVPIKVFSRHLSGDFGASDFT